MRRASRSTTARGTGLLAVLGLLLLLVPSLPSLEASPAPSADGGFGSRASSELLGHSLRDAYEAAPSKRAGSPLLFLADRAPVSGSCPGRDLGALAPEASESRLAVTLRRGRSPPRS